MAQLLEITIWAVVFVSRGEFARLAATFYHLAMLHTSVGFGDAVMSNSRKLLGPLETANGLLMFGVSTAMIFAICSICPDAIRQFRHCSRRGEPYNHNLEMCGAIGSPERAVHSALR